MGNNSDGCHDGHSVQVIEAKLAEKSSDFLSEEFSSNDLKLAENIISTNFNENTLLLVLAKDDEKNDKEFQIINNVDSSHERTDAISEKSLRDYFHLDNAVATPNLCEDICAKYNSCDGYAFDKFEHTVPTPKQNWSGRLVATSIMVVNKVHNH